RGRPPRNWFAGTSAAELDDYLRLTEQAELVARDAFDLRGVALQLTHLDPKPPDLIPEAGHFHVDAALFFAKCAESRGPRRREDHDRHRDDRERKHQQG